MEKQAYLPIKFYPVNGWQEYERLKEYPGDKTLIIDDYRTAPAFQMVLPDIGRHWDRATFYYGTFDMINYDTGTTYDMTSYPMLPIMHNGAGSFRTLVYRRFPRMDTGEFTPGRYYYHLSEIEGDTHWYSEVFELCNLQIDAFDEELNAGFDNDTGFASFTSTYQLGWGFADVTFYKTGAALASAYMEFSAFLEEEFDLYVKTEDATGGAGTDWDEPVFLYLNTDDNVLISDICRVDTTNTLYHFKLKAESGGTIRLYMYIKAADATEGTMYVSLNRTHTDRHVQLRWSDDKNFCKMVYDQQTTQAPFDYENIYFLKTKNDFTAQAIDENSLNETTVEDDEANKYRIIGTNQKWNSMQFFGSECFLNAMSALRLHSNIEIIKENGEPIDVVDLMIEQSVNDYHGALVKLLYREESCSRDACGFDICCPVQGGATLLVVETANANFPAAASYNHQRAMEFTSPGRVGTVYLSNGVAWGVDTSFDVANYCLEVQNFMGGDFARYAAAGSQWRYFYYPSGGPWYPVIQISSVADATGGQATVNIYAQYWTGSDVWCQVEYYAGSEWEIPLPYHIDESEWTPVIEKENLASATGARALTATCGAGTYYFRVHIWDGDCDMGYCPPVSQTIT